MNDIIKSIRNFIENHDGINNKNKLTALVFEKFSLTKDGSIYYCDEFAIRFSSSHSARFSNTVLALSRLQKFDHKIFIACLVTPKKNYLYLANTTFLKKISQTSQELRENNIKGSFNGSDIVREFAGIENIPDNFDRLFDIHATIGFDGNLIRLVDATTGIRPTGEKFAVTAALRSTILDSPIRAYRFIDSEEAIDLKRDLDEKVDKFRSEILIAALIENVNVRGRIIEYLIAGEDEQLRQDLISALRGNREIPPFRNGNNLGDYTKIFNDFHTETDVKTKIMILSSNPKAYNLDKILEFLTTPKSVFMFYFVGIDPYKTVNTVLLSMFQTKLLKATILLKHWAGRNSRGVSQFEGRTIGELIRNPEIDIDKKAAVAFLEKIIDL